jgi:hypothetical protein
VLFTVDFLLLVRADELRFSFEGSVNGRRKDSAQCLPSAQSLVITGRETKVDDFHRSVLQPSADGNDLGDLDVAAPASTVYTTS